jgi:6-phospho-beta-glucosidase
MIDSGLIHWQRAFLNEYLHYYYHRDEVLRSLLAKSETRGEQVERLTRSMLERLQAVDSTEERLAVYHEIMRERSATYMAHARRDESMPSPGEAHMAHNDDEGYAGVALGCVEAIATGTPHYTGLNVPNAGTIPGLRDDDIVEVGCWVDADGIRPLPLGDEADIPPDQLLLMQTVKQYERLASQAILQRSRELAVQALTVHPLVGSYPLACSLVNAFLEAHRDLVGEWR